MSSAVSPSVSPAESPRALPAVLFDLDGTLVDSEPNYYEASRRVLAAHGVEGFGWEEHTGFLGIGTEETMRVLRRRYALDAPVERLVAEKDRAYLELARRRTEPFAGMRRFVELLHTAGHPLAVASGSTHDAIDAALTCAGLDALLTVRVSAQDVERGKPSPDIFLRAAGLLGAEAADCVVVEDAPAGVEAADRAGMRCLAVPSVPETADNPAFAAAGLLTKGGQREFDPHHAYDWTVGRAE